MNQFPEYHYGTGRSYLIFHEENMRTFLPIWRKAKAANITLPETTNTAYDSLEHLLSHVLRSARYYMLLISENLELPDPQIKEPPALDVIEMQAEDYMEYLLEKYLSPLANLDEEGFNKPEFVSAWGATYSVDSMLEHALLHPKLHYRQLEELIEEQK